MTTKTANEPVITIVRIVIAFSIWATAYQFAMRPAVGIISVLHYYAQNIPIIRIFTGWAWDETLVFVVGILFSFLPSLLLKKTLEVHVCTALSLLWLAMLGFILPIAQGYEPYFNYVFLSIIVGTIIGWQTRRALLSENDEKTKAE